MSGNGLRMAAAAALMVLASPALAGTWTFGREARGNPELKYVEDGKAIFYIGCGRAFGLHVKYPGTPGAEEDPATITLTSGKSSMSFEGEFEAPFEDMATTFLQWDLGFDRKKPELFGKKWEAVRDRLLDILDSGNPLVVSTGRDSYRLPANDARKWRKAFDHCG